MQFGGILGILGILWYTERIYQRGISNIPKYTIEIPKDLFLEVCGNILKHQLGIL